MSNKLIKIFLEVPIGLTQMSDNFIPAIFIVTATE